MEFFELHLAEIPKRTVRKGSFKKNGIRKYLNKFEVKEIVNLYPDKFNYELAKAFNVSESAILRLRRKYNLSKSERIMDAKKFQKGNKPFNSGKKHIHNSLTKFKKGHVPLNHKPVGSKRITKGENGYHEVKTSEPNEWKLAHRIVWQRHYGEIPAGMIIIFRDDNKSNINIANLEMISRKDNMRRNHNRLKFSETMKALWRIEKLRNFYGMTRKTNLRIRN